MKAARNLFIGVAALGVACSRWDLPVEIPFHATWHGKSIACYGTEPALTDLRFYVTNTRLVDGKGREHVVRFANEFEWENDAVALIDLETGSGSCAAGSPEVFDRVIGVARAGEYRGLRFTVGVPFRINHADPRNAIPPLDRQAMHGGSVSGFRFLRAGVTAAGSTFEIQIGSTDCDGSFGYVTSCAYPNRIEVFLPDFVPGSAVAINIDRLLETDGLEGTRRCLTGPPEDGTCNFAYAALGIDPAAGLPTGGQRVFSQLDGR